MREYCGVAGLIGDFPDLYKKVYLALFSLQHRGQESSGLSLFDGQEFWIYKKMGYAKELMEIEKHKDKGFIGIGHVRYKTAGDSNIANAQPIFAQTNYGPVAMAHNGNLVNFKPLFSELRKAGSIFQGNSDTELIIHLLARKRSPFLEALKETLNEIKGAFSMVLMTKDALWGIRDPHGMRPLVYGKIDDGYVIASETSAIDILNGEYLGEVPEGNILRIDRDGKIEFIPFAVSKAKRHCVFEHIYFARPDSNIFSRNVHKMRYRIGQELALEYPSLKADIVVAVPDSGLSAALGFSHESKIPLDRGLIRNHYIGRSFINPTQEERVNAVRMKLQPVLDVIKGKDIALIDDSMVRGTTSREIIIILKQRQVGKIHYFLASPPIKYSCYFGIDTPDRGHLIANKYDPKGIANYLGIESVNYLSLEGLKKVFGEEADDNCYACFTGDYHMENENGAI